MAIGGPFRPAADLSRLRYGHIPTIRSLKRTAAVKSRWLTRFSARVSAISIGQNGVNRSAGQRAGEVWPPGQRSQASGASDAGGIAALGPSACLAGSPTARAVGVPCGEPDC
jgi:hypothetical protein